MEHPDGSVGGHKSPESIPDAIMKGGQKHDYSEIRSPVLAFVVYDTPDGPPQNQIEKYHVTNAGQRTVVDAVYGLYIGMTRIRIERVKRAAGGARVVDLWGTAISYSSRMKGMCCANCEVFWNPCIKSEELDLRLFPDCLKRGPCAADEISRFHHQTRFDAVFWGVPKKACQVQRLNRRFLSNILWRFDCAGIRWF